MTRFNQRGRCLGAALASIAAATTAAIAASPLLAASNYTCSGAQVSIFTNYNGGATRNGGTSPGFTTHGHPYCLVWIQTYHWNNGNGARPGKIGLSGSLTNLFQSKVAPRRASNVPSGPVRNAGWIVNFNPLSKPVIIDGHYACQDSSPATWAQDPQSHGRGFCAVEGERAKR